MASFDIGSGRRTIGLSVVLLGLTMTGCVAQGPAGPSVMVLPAKGETFTTFQQHDATCRQFATDQIGDRNPENAAAQRSAGGAVLGAGVGAAAGALLGSASGHAGKGAAIGGGSGLLAGLLFGSAHGRNAAASLQHRYDIAYTQCMAANGEQIDRPPPREVMYAPPPPPAVVYVPTPVYPGVAYPPPPPPGAEMPPTDDAPPPGP